VDLQEVGWGGMDWIELAEDRDGCWAFIKCWWPVSFSGRTMLCGVSWVCSVIHICISEMTKSVSLLGNVQFTVTIAVQLDKERCEDGNYDS
jgi:hypothetical protein